MRLAISNIAWTPAEDRSVAAQMRAHGFTGVEIAPTKYWPRPLAATAAQVREVREFWTGEGLPAVAMQSLLFGSEGLALFAEDAARAAMAAYLTGVIRLGARLGVGVLVFGSPKNRLRGALSAEAADKIAIPFFRTLGAIAAGEGVCLCIEPNPAAYGCDWITTSAEGLRLVGAMDSPGFGLHLDAAGMTLSGEEVSAAITNATGAIRHFHASAPDLAPVGEDGIVDHAALAMALRAQNYARIISIEMREATAAIPAALARIARLYGSDSVSQPGDSTPQNLS